MSTLLSMLQSKQKELAAKRVRDNTTKVPQGQSRWRILPHWSGDVEKPPFHDFGKHFVKNFAGETEAVYLCTAKTYGRECPVCAAITRGEVTVKDDNAKQLISGAKAAQRYLVNAVLKDPAKGYGAEVVILELPTGAFDDVLSAAALYAADGVNIFHPVEGFDVVFDRSGTGLKTKYKAQLAPKATELPAALLSQAKNLDDYVSQEYEEGKTKALAALGNLSGASTPSLPAALTRPRAAVAAGASEVLPAAAPTASVTPTVAAAEAEESLDIDLGDINLDDLDEIDGK